MAKTAINFELPLAAVVEGAIGPFGPYCMGYLNPGSFGIGYVSTLKLSTGVVGMEGLDAGTETIVSYDRCEKNDAYIGQVNMLTASSFCGVNGAIWGYHLAAADEIRNGTLKPKYYETRQDNKKVPVYAVGPLLDAAIRLFGTAEQRRFPPMPGAHIICANKSWTSSSQEATWVWAALALAIAENRATDANLFIEDCGQYGNESTTEQEADQLLNSTERAVTKSIVMCGTDQDVLYKEIFCGYVKQFVPKGQVGCALACAPYILLAQNAVPPTGASSILNMTITQWEQVIGLLPLPWERTKPSAKQVGHRP